MEGDVQVCEHCKRSVSSAHFALHEVHCVRFLAICPKCKEPILKTEMEQHLENSHKKVKCAMCQQKVQKHLLEVHEAEECPLRQAECQFCELAVSFSKLKIHEHHCGSRTELCQDCKQYILLRELAHHKDHCKEQAQPMKGKKMSTPMRTINCNSCNQMIPVNEYAHHTDKCHPVSESAKLSPSRKPRNASLFLPVQFAVDQTSTARRDVRPKTTNKNRFPLLSENSTKREPRDKRKLLNPPSTSELKLRTTSALGDEEDYDILRKCPQCDILLPLPTLNRHQEKCQWLASAKGKYMRYSS